MKTCAHVKANGNICQAPHLRNEKYCYFHMAARDRARRQREAAARNLPFRIPLLEDTESIRLALGDIVNAMLTDRIDHRKAAIAVYALQTASNLRGVVLETDDRFWDPYAPEHDPSLPELPEDPALDLPKKPAAATTTAPVAETTPQAG